MRAAEPPQSRAVLLTGNPVNALGNGIHDFATALQLGGNVLVMKEGKIIESGEVQSVFDHTTEPYTRSLIEAYSLSCAFTKGAES